MLVRALVTAGARRQAKSRVASRWDSGAMAVQCRFVEEVLLRQPRLGMLYQQAQKMTRFDAVTRALTDIR